MVRASLSETDKILGQESYAQYLYGAIILNDPEAEVSVAIHGRELTDENLPTIIAHSEKLMVEGLRGVIKYAIPSDIRGNLATLQSRFEQAVPQMVKIRDDFYETQAQRANELNPVLKALRPLPVLEQGVYRYLCRGRMHLLKTTRLMGGLVASTHFNELLVGKSVSNEIEEVI